MQFNIKQSIIVNYCLPLGTVYSNYTSCTLQENKFEGSKKSMNKKNKFAYVVIYCQKNQFIQGTIFIQHAQKE